jgi:hypothetical protein
MRAATFFLVIPDFPADKGIRLFAPDIAARTDLAPARRHFFHCHLRLLSAGALACYTPKVQNCLSPTGDGYVRVFLKKDIRNILASINGLPKEEETLYIMPERLLYISLIDEYAQVNLKRGMRIDIMHARNFKETCPASPVM